MWQITSSQLLCIVLSFREKGFSSKLDHGVYEKGPGKGFNMSQETISCNFPRALALTGTWRMKFHITDGATWYLQAPGSPTAGALELAVVHQRYLRPEPRVRLGTLLGRNRVTRACVDLSDGLADAARQLASSSDVGVVVYADAVPVEPEARQWYTQQSLDPIDTSVIAGEDYELLFTVSPSDRRRLDAVQRLIKDCPLTKIGEVTKTRELVLRRNGKDRPLPAGFEHFTSESGGR